MRTSGSLAFLWHLVAKQLLNALGLQTCSLTAVGKVQATHTNGGAQEHDHQKENCGDERAVVRHVHAAKSQFQAIPFSGLSN